MERNGAQVGAATIPANGLEKIFLPWVPELKGPDFDACTSVSASNVTSRVPGGSFHLVSSVPVTVYQFSALELGSTGGPPGKDWSACPGPQCGVSCFSYSNDASLLLPSTALTGNYRVTGYKSCLIANMDSYVTITGIEDGTTVSVTHSPSAAPSPAAVWRRATPGRPSLFPSGAARWSSCSGRCRAI